MGIRIPRSLRILKQKFFPDKKFRKARVWSNKELKKVGPLFSGAVINVSGWKDEDKVGGHYRDYFTNASSYAISNFSGERGMDGNKGDIFIDLEKPLPKEQHGRFDVVFNHTTLEHIFDVFTAFANLALLSKDIVVLAVPFVQEMHTIEDSFKDYWRFTPFALEQLCAKHGLTIVYMSATNEPRQSVYLFMVASKQPKKWEGRFPRTAPEVFTSVGTLIFG